MKKSFNFKPLFLLLFYRTMNNSESARKLSQAMNNTSKAVGGALNQAKERFSSLWTTFTTPNSAVPLAETIESQIKVDAIDSEPKELTEPSEGVIKQIAKKLHNSELSLKQERDTASNQGGIVEIGREANTLDTNRQNDIIDI